MAKQYLRIGQVLKGQKNEETGVTKPSYIKLTNHLPTLQRFVGALQDYISGGAQNSFYVNVESKAQQLESLDNAVRDGRMSPENAEKAKERVSKIPDFVLFDLTTGVERKD